MSTSKVNILICMPDPLGCSPDPYMVEGTCDFCKGAVLYGRGNQRRVQQENIQLMCLRCYIAKHQAIRQQHPDVGVMHNGRIARVKAGHIVPEEQIN